MENTYQTYNDCLAYIDAYWDKITYKPDKHKINHHVIAIPHTFVTPNEKWLSKFSHMFYWDTFFMFRGLIGTKREWILKDMVNNFVFLFEQYGIIPNFNAPVSMGRSQPPFLTSMILDTYNGYYFPYLRKGKIRRLLTNLRKQRSWLKRVTEIAKKEYEQIWIDKAHLYNHSVKGYELNRYGDRDVGFAHSSELESGWDFTSRFYSRCNEFLPIDLNVLLFKYERDFAKIAFHLKNHKEQASWKKKAAERKEAINKYMWNSEEGFFYDYGYANQRQSDFLSLAGFVPLWAGLATKSQAGRMIEKLPKFETDYGLTITAKESLAPQIDLRRIPSRYRHAIEDIIKPKQWDYPNSWPPLEYLTVIGLLKYGYIDHAKRLMEKYLTTHAALFREYKTFFEKVNAVTGENAHSFQYEHQSGFGWTNAVFYRYVQILKAFDRGDNIYMQPKAEEPPYRLSIIH